MSETAKKAHEALCRSYSNVPAFEKLSERSQGLLDAVGKKFEQLDQLNAQYRAAEAELDACAQATEDSLKEELGELVPVPRNPLADLLGGGGGGGIQLLSMEELSKLLGESAPEGECDDPDCDEHH